jgi:hypothetical protein
MNFVCLINEHNERACVDTSGPDWNSSERVIDLLGKGTKIDDHNVKEVNDRTDRFETGMAGFRDCTVLDKSCVVWCETLGSDIGKAVINCLNERI